MAGGRGGGRWGDGGYVRWGRWGTAGSGGVAARSERGSGKGPWEQEEEPVVPENAGHGVVFRDLDGELKFLLHYPNDK